MARVLLLGNADQRYGEHMNMKFNIRKCIRYFNVEVEIENAKFDLGLMGPEERALMATTLRDAADELDPPVES